VAAVPAAPVSESASPTPASGARAFSGAINRGELETAVACFSWGGMLVTPDATAVRGEASIRGILAQLIDRGTAIEVEASEVRVREGIATVSERWQIRTPGPEGTEHLQSSFALLVLRPGSEAWKLAFAAPWRTHGG
jgi:ketosteroid isomerase-like protein